MGGTIGGEGLLREGGERGGVFFFFVVGWIREGFLIWTLQKPFGGVTQPEILYT